MAELQDIMNQIDAEEGDEDELWDKAWNTSSDEVIELSSDWKHLEVYGHEDELIKVGIEMKFLWTDHKPPDIVEVNVLE